MQQPTPGLFLPKEKCNGEAVVIFGAPGNPRVGLATSRSGGFGPDQLIDEIAGAIRLGPSHMLGLFENLIKRYSVDQLKGDMVDRVNLLLFTRPSSPILLPGQEPGTDAEEMREAEQTVRQLADLSVANSYSRGDREFEKAGVS